MKAYNEFIESLNEVSESDSVWTIFKRFLRRDFNFSDTDANWEVDFFKNTLKINKDMSEKDIVEKYITTVRKGAKLKLTRKERRSIVLSLSNAFNHAGFKE